MKRLEGKVAIITGAAKGIGLACAKRFVAEGAKVVLADVNEQQGTAEAKRLGSSADFVRCDVGDAKDVSNLVTEAGKIFGADFLDLRESDFDKVLRVNLRGAFLVGQAVAKKMVEQVAEKKKPGTIVNMASINSTVAIPNQVPYSVSKGGLLQLTRTMALSLAPHGIRVNAIGPGSIMTEILAAIATDRDAKRRILSRTPLARIGKPEEVASVAAFLASEDASYITGEIIYVDGGR